MKGAAAARLTHRPSQIIEIQQAYNELRINVKKRGDETCVQWGERLGYAPRTLAICKGVDDQQGRIIPSAEMDEMTTAIAEETNRSAKLFFEKQTAHLMNKLLNGPT